MENQAAVIEKIKKILALAERGGTEEEAATAANMAAGLAMKYGIDLAAVQGAKTVARGFKEVVIAESTKYEQWLLNLVSAVGTLHLGKPFYRQASSGYTTYYVVIREELGDAARLTVEYLMGSIKRLNRLAVNGRQLDIVGRREFRAAFRLAASRRIAQRLRERLQAMQEKDDVAQESTGQNALVVATHVQAELRDLQEWMENEGFEFEQSKKKGKVIRSEAGYEAGLKAGNSIGLDPQLKSQDNEAILKKLGKPY